MQTTRLFLALTLASSALSVFAAAPVPGQAQLQLSAQASRETALDEMTVHFAVEAEGSDPGALNQTVLSRAQEALSLAKKTSGVSARLMGVSTQQVYGPKGTPVGWKVRAQLAVKGSDLPKVGALAGSLGSRLQVAGVEFSLSAQARSALEAELTTEAAAALHQKAAATTKALGFSRYALEEVSLLDESQPGPRPVMALRRGGMEMMAMAAHDGAPVPADGGTTVVSVRFGATARLTGGQ